MELNTHYDALWTQSLEKFKKNEFKTDPLIDSENDLRRGITLLIRPNEVVKKSILKLTAELQQIDPHQYYYPTTDFHITVMSIISCYEGFDLNKIDLSKYVALINLSLKSVPKEKITFKGITASDSCIMLKGFPESDILNTIRTNLRQNFHSSSLEHSIDKRYKIITAHSTIARFKNTVQNPDKIISVLKKYREYNFGTFEIENYELVVNDWYQKEIHTKKLHEF